MSALKIGDEVICINNSGGGESLKLNTVYTVARLRPGTDWQHGFVYLTGGNGIGYYSRRFILADVPDFELEFSI